MVGVRESAIGTPTMDRNIWWVCIIYLSCVCFNCIYCFNYSYSLLTRVCLFVCLFLSAVLYHQQQCRRVLYQHLCHHDVLPPAQPEHRISSNYNRKAIQQWQWGWKSWHTERRIALTQATSYNNDNGNRKIQTCPTSATTTTFISNACKSNNNTMTNTIPI